MTAGMTRSPPGRTLRGLARLLGIAALLALTACASVRLDLPRTPSHAIDDPQQTALGRIFARQLAAAAPGQPDAGLRWTSLEAGQPVRYTREPLASAWRRLLAPIFSWFAPEELL